MTDLADFNDPDHKTASASALIQKGIYHLFVLKHDQQADVFARVLRMYQCLYQLCSAMYLLDPASRVNPDVPQVRGALKRQGEDPKKPTRDKIDPCIALTHSDFDGPWRGFPSDHPLHGPSISTLMLFKRAIDARHTVIYRPMLLAREGWCWEDCPLFDYLARLPRATDVERVYTEVCTALAEEFSKQRTEQKRRISELNAGQMSDSQFAAASPLWAVRLFREILQEYKDEKGGRPTETIIQSYARLFAGESAKFLGDLGAFQDHLLKLSEVRGTLGLVATGS